MDTGPSLKLVVEKGPRRGESLDCRPGGHVRIGRVVRGNTFTVKDPSISQKHVSIEFTSAGSGGGLWTLTDLDTSNGTFLNSVVLDPLVPAALKNGDVVKIGEDTSITVRIVEHEEAEQPEEMPAAVTATLRPRRTAAARRGKGAASRLATEVEELKPKDSAASGVVRRTGRARRNIGVTDSTSQLPDDVTCPDDSAIETEEQKDDPIAPEPAEELKPKDSAAGGGVRRTGRARRNIAVVDSISQLPDGLTCPEDGAVETEEQIDDHSAPEPAVELKQNYSAAGEPVRRACRARRNVGVSDSIPQLPQGLICSDNSTVETEEQKDDHIAPEPEDHSVLEPEKKPAVPRAKRGRKRGMRKASVRELAHSDLGVEKDGVIVLDTPDRFAVSNQKLPVLSLADGEIGSLAADRVTTSASTAATAAGHSSLGKFDEEDVDMDNMTLGQWFDRLEKVLPLMLKDVCDEIIADIKEKANLYNAFVLESAQDGR